MTTERSAAFSEAARMMRNAIFVVGRSPMPWPIGECCLDGDMKVMESLSDGRERTQREHLETLLAEMDKVIGRLEAKAASAEQEHGSIHMEVG
jgi:hypothetical protein